MDFQKDLESYPGIEQEKEPEIKYSTADTVFALLSFVFGFLFVRWVLLAHQNVGLGGTVLTVAFSIMSGIYLRFKGTRIMTSHLAGLVGIDILSLSYFIFENELVLTMVTFFIIIAFAYWFFTVTKDSVKIDDLLPAELFASVLIVPFGSFGKVFGATKSGIKNSSLGKKIGMILLGILVAVIPTAIVTSLLMSADEAFVNLTDDLFSDIFRDLPKNIWYFILGIPVAMYVFGMMYANSVSEKREYVSREKTDKALTSMRVAPAILVCASVTPIIIVYLLFFFSQMGYFLSAFSGIRPEGITYAEYARRGFFELCIVAVINLIIILVACLIAKRENGKASGAVRGYVITLSISTLILISIAISKMVMYIDAYGLTRLRVYTTWFMIALAVLFIFIIARQISARFNLFRNFAVIAVAMFVVFVFSDVDGLIARYNVRCYESGKFETVDIDAMYELSDSAIKYIAPLVDDNNPKVSADAKEYVDFKKMVLHSRDDGFANFNLTTHFAKKVVGAEKSE